MNIFGPFKKDNTISKKVMEVVESRIVNAQAKYDEGTIGIDEDANAKIAIIDEKRVTDKEKLAETLASSVLSG